MDIRIVTWECLCDSVDRAITTGLPVIGHYYDFDCLVPLILTQLFALGGSPLNAASPSSIQSCTSSTPTPCSFHLCSRLNGASHSAFASSILPSATSSRNFSGVSKILLTINLVLV